MDESSENKEAMKIDLIRKVVNLPRKANLWNFLGLGFIYGASEDIE